MSDKEESGSHADDRERKAREKNWFTNQVAPLDEDLVRNPGDRPKSSFPEGFEDRYFTKPGRNEVTIYADSKGDKELFRDTGDRLKTKEPSELAVKAMVETAQHREWQSITLRGSNEFKRDVWLEGQARSMDVKGYRPSELDMQEMKNREQRYLQNEMSRHGPTPVKTDHEHEETRSRISTHDPKEQERRELVEAIIERDLRKQFPDDPHQVLENMERARRSLDERDARGEKLPDLKVREVREFEVVKDHSLQSVSMDQIKQNVKRQQRDKDIEKVR